MLTRARFLAACGAALVGAAIAVPASFARESDGRPRAQPGADEFRRHEGTEFLLRGADGTQRRLVLAHVAERTADARLEQFSLLFVAQEPFGDGTFELLHAGLGRTNVFLAAVGGHGAAASYEACFTRFRDGRHGG